MSDFFDRFKFNCSPVAHLTHTIVRGGVRLTVITPCLLRVEEQSGGKFCNEPTQSVWFRDFCEPEFKLNESSGTIEIKTTRCNFLYSVKMKKMLRIKLRDGRVVTNYNSGNLKGTCRTLDVSAGVPIVGDGVCSKNGVAVLDDSDTLVLTSDGRILPRAHKESDKYYFAYGSDYIGATTDLYKLTGKVPLIPRYALSNWWSRYKAYSQQEYLDLMDRFKAEKIPITVATVDMDWHWVDIKTKFGKDSHKVWPHRNMMEYVYDFWSAGWTGYSFNTDLFPDPDAFLKKLKDDGYKVTFNLHPSQGVRWYENQYNDMCKAMGQDPSTKKPVKFDITDKKFIENYFEILHRPFEKKGVDFWWIDWQQGTHTKVAGLDPLWALNHYHFYDNANGGHRPLILSRFAGAGSQRYPLGFSGDTVQMWSSLEFQPYFTATAANVGYPWWSHDIGGHCLGKKDDELYIRWLELGVFSPVMRLHSTANEFMGKEPWNYSGPVRRVATDNLRLRHALLPYIYTMNRRTSEECRAICEPMYYTYPNEENAYKCKNEYFFGTELIVAPITEHTSKDTNMAGVNAWIPEGRYTDIFTGRIYSGNRFVKIYRDIEYIPVLAKAGAIIPMSANTLTNDCSNPEKLNLLVYRGNNTFKLYEDDGETLNYMNGAFAQTPFTVKADGSTVSFTVSAVEGDASVVPQSRAYCVELRDIVSGDIVVTLNGQPVEYTLGDGKTMSVIVDGVKPSDELNITVTTATFLGNMPKKQALIETIAKFQMMNDVKTVLFNDLVMNDKGIPAVSDSMSGPLEEILELYRG